MGRPQRRSVWRTIADWFSTLLVFAVLALAIVYFQHQSESEFAGFFRVIDGDSLSMDGEEIRLVGIDAPEFSQNCGAKEAEWACGRDAARHLGRLVENTPIRCKGTKRDRFGRLLAICLSGTDELNRIMVAQGWAVSFGRYETEETAARTQRLGIWKSEFVRPQRWRRENLGDMNEAQGRSWLKRMLGN